MAFHYLLLSSTAAGQDRRVIISHPLRLNEAREQRARFSRKGWGTQHCSEGQKQIFGPGAPGGKPQQAISAAEHLQRNNSSVSRLFAFVISGNAYLDLGQTAAASQQAAMADETVKATDPAWADQIVSWLDLLHLRLDASRGNREKMTERFNKLCLVPVLPSLDQWSETLFQLEYISRVGRKLGDWNAAALAANRMTAYAPQYRGTHLALADIARHDGNKAAEERELKLAGRFP